MLTCQVSSLLVYSVAFDWQKTPNFAILGNSAFCVVAAYRGSWTRVYSYKPYPIQRYQHHFYSIFQQLQGKIVHTNCRSKAWRTHKQTSKRADAKLAAYTDSLNGPNLASDSEPVVYACRLNVHQVGVLRRQYGAKKPPKYSNFDQIFTFLGGEGALVPIPVYQSGPNLARDHKPAV